MRIGTLTAELDATKIVKDDENELVVPAILNRERVLKYADGKAFRPGEEIEKSLFTLEGAWVTSEQHPANMILTRPDEITGQIKNVDLNVKGDEYGPYVATGNIHLFKKRNSKEFIDSVKKGERKDVSVGFLFEKIDKKGTYNGEAYDYIQKNILYNHVAAGVSQGRCSSPMCGISVDEAIQKIVDQEERRKGEPKTAAERLISHIEKVGVAAFSKSLVDRLGEANVEKLLPSRGEGLKDKNVKVVDPSKYKSQEEMMKDITAWVKSKLKGDSYFSLEIQGDLQFAGDPWEETENSIRSGHRDKGVFDPDSFRTIELTEGVKAVVACPKGKFIGGKCQVGTQVQTYIFDKNKFSMSEAKKWFSEHKTDSETENTNKQGPPKTIIEDKNNKIDIEKELERSKKLFKTK